MARFSTPQKTWQLIVLVIAVAATVLVRTNRQTPPAHESRAPAAEKKSGAWERLEGCTLAEDRNNDGDSFALRCGGRTHIFRLYFADCPEKYRHQYNGERIADQAQYFGGIREEAAIAAGVQAKDFSLALLAKGPVTVETRWEPVYDSGRCYAFVKVGGQDLAEALVDRGLARIFTKGVDRVDGRTARDQRERLQQLEREAKSKKRGAWGAR